MARPVFTSYTWNDPDPGEVDTLEQAARLRGVPTWRDRRGMSFGSHNEERVRQAIEELCSGFVLYGTDAVLASDFILNIELPAMAARRRRGETPFFAGAINRRSLRFAAGAEELRAASGVAIGEQLGADVSGRSLDEELRSASVAILHAYLAQELSGEQVTARIETRGEIPETDEALVHLNWSPPLTHDPAEHPAEVWDEHLLPALGDLHATLDSVEAPQILQLGGKMHLSAALAIGWEFRQPTGWTLDLRHDFLSCATELVAPDPSGWRINSEPGPVDGHSRLVVCLHATKDVARAMDAHSRSLPPARCTLHIYPPGGEPLRNAVEPEIVNPLAAAIAQEIDRCRAEYGTSESHLYVACPWPMAVALGWHLSSCGRLVMHEADVERGSYRASCRLA